MIDFFLRENDEGNDFYVEIENDDEGENENVHDLKHPIDDVNESIDLFDYTIPSFFDTYLFFLHSELHFQSLPMLGHQSSAGV